MKKNRVLRKKIRVTTCPSLWRDWLIARVRAVATRAAARSGSRWKRPVNDASVASSPAARPATRIARQAIDIAAGGLCRRLIKNLS